MRLEFKKPTEEELDADVQAFVDKTEALLRELEPTRRIQFEKAIELRFTAKPKGGYGKITPQKLATRLFKFHSKAVFYMELIDDACASDIPASQKQGLKALRVTFKRIAEITPGVTPE